MSKAYVILGMKRSGHHAIVYWIANNLSGKSVIYNDCRFGWKGRKLMPNPAATPIMQIGKLEEEAVDNHIYNIEDFDICDLDKYDFRNFHNICDNDYIQFILVLRDPFNWIASSLKTNSDISIEIDKRISLWLKQANLFFNKDVYQYIYRLNYNNWFISDEYKKELSKIFQLDSWENNINSTSPRGGGSSFDGMHMKNKAKDMKVLDRWQYYQRTDKFATLFSSELIDTGNKIFKLNLTDKLLRKKPICE